MVTASELCRVRLDGSAFIQHRRSGISRYMAELVRAFDSDLSLGVTPVTPYRWVANVHASSTSSRFRSLPLPRRLREPVLGTLNRRRSGEGGADLAHFPIYDPTALDSAHEPRLVTTVHDFTWERFPELFGDMSTALAHKRRYLQAADVLLCVSEATRDDLHHFHPDLTTPVVVTPLAAGPEFYSPRNAPVRGLPARYLLHVGNRAEHKNVNLLFAAFAAIMKQHDDLWLVLSGAGLPDENERLGEAGIAHRTKVIRASDHDLPTLYRHAAAMVFPSRYEGFGLPIIEALAARCPIIISDAPASVEVAADAALVVGVDELDALVEAIDQVISDSNVARALREAGARRAADFSWHRTAVLTAAAYHSVAASYT